MDIPSGPKIYIDSSHCHIHNKSNSDSEYVNLQKQNLDSIFQRHEDNLIRSVKRLVSNMKKEILTEINSSCVVNNCSQSNSSSEEVSTNSTEPLTFPFPLSELDDSSELEFEVAMGNKDAANLEKSSGKKRKILYVEDTTYYNKRYKREIELQNCKYNNTPSHSSPMQQKFVAKTLNFSSCSSESDESFTSNDQDKMKIKSHTLSKLLSPLGKWKGVESLDTILEAPDETFQEYSADSLTPQSWGRTGTLSPVSSEPSDFSDVELPSMKIEGGHYRNFSIDDDQYEADPFYDFTQLGPPLKTYFKSCLKLESIQEEDEFEPEECTSSRRTL